MAEMKYARFIVTEPMAEEHGYEVKDGPDVMSAMAYLDGGVIPGAFYAETHWFHKPTKYSPKKHAHDFDEILAFMGGDAAQPTELNGEVELYIEDERHVLTKSCLVYIPAGVNHCPMNFLRVDRPIFHFSTGTSTRAYERDGDDGQDREE
jgi:mannose-6-phosphate isomerase-like protein (cupin superfamily)